MMTTIIIIMIIFIFLFVNHINIYSCEEYDLPLCRGNEYVIGHWKFVPTIDKKLHECCTVDDVRDGTERKICSSQVFDRASYYFNGSDRIGDGRLVKTQKGSQTCDCDEGLHSFSNVTDRERYKWTPFRCKLVEWDSHLFCDSLMSLTAVTLMNMIAYTHGGCSEQIMFIHRNYLTFHEKLLTSLYDTYLIYNKPEIMIINAGAWLKDLGDMITILSHLDSQIPMILSNQSNSQSPKIIWRSQLVGHYECDRNKPFRPFSQRLPDKYAWNYFPLWDNMAYNMTKKLGIDWLDMSPLFWRSDAHPMNGDCLHPCIPGPLDLFSIILLQRMILGEL